MPKAPKAKVGQSKKPIHPNSRKAMVLARNESHGKRLQKSKNEKKSKLENLVEKTKWFQAELLNGIEIKTRAELAELVEIYFQRFELELEQIKLLNSIGHRQGNRHAARESAIRMTLDMEKSQFNGGDFEVPDLTNEENCDILKKWEGNNNYLPKIKMIKISVKDLTGNKDKLSASSEKISNSKKEVTAAKDEEIVDDIDEDKLLEESDEDVEMNGDDKC